jgi:hypothetical protein
MAAPWQAGAADDGISIPIEWARPMPDSSKIQKILRDLPVSILGSDGRLEGAAFPFTNHSSMATEGRAPIKIRRNGPIFFSFLKRSH